MSGLEHVDPKIDFFGKVTFVGTAALKTSAKGKRWDDTNWDKTDSKPTLI